MTGTPIHPLFIAPLSGDTLSGGNYHGNYHVSGRSVSNAAELSALSQTVPSLFPTIKVGDSVITNGRGAGCTHLWDGHRLHALVDEPDHRGVCPPTLTVPEGQPINIYSHTLATNSYWWPTSKQRAAVSVAAEDLRCISDNYGNQAHCADIMSDGHLFRFFITEESDFQRGIFRYFKDEYEDISGYCERSGPGIVLCFVGPSTNEPGTALYR